VRTKIISSLAVFLAGFVVFAAAPVQSAGVKSAQVFKDWSVHVAGKKKKKICYLHGEPKKSTGKYKRRGPTYLQVTQRVADGARNEVSITAGYSYKKGSAVTVKFDDKNFSMFTDGSTAWSRDARGDAALVKAMRAGKSMIVTGVSGRGTATKDRYSLAGFTAAHKAINKSCGKK
jgi:invasion protein IalB